jgi:hypothetical protein
VQVTGSNLKGIHTLDTVQKMAHSAASETKMQRLWRRRLSHLSRKSMELLAGGMATGIVFSDTDDEPCTACIKGKYSKVMFKYSQV